MTVLAVEPPLRQWECSMSYMQVDKVTVNSLGTTDTLSRPWRLQKIWQELLRELPVDPGASIKPQRKRREINQTQTNFVCCWFVFLQTERCRTLFTKRCQFSFATAGDRQRGRDEDVHLSGLYAGEETGKSRTYLCGAARAVVPFLR